MTSIALPDGTSYQITYEATPGGPSGAVTGRIASITLPTGGEITYQYTGSNDGVNCSDGSTMGLTRTTPDGVWTYARAAISGTPQYTTTITDPQNNQTVVTFEGPYEIERQVYQGSASPSNLLKTTYTCYNGAAYPCSTYAANNNPMLNAVQQRTVYTVWPSGLESETNTDYDYNSSTGISRGLVTEVDEYGYGSGAPGSLSRKTVTSYNTSLTNGIYDRPATVTVYNADSSTAAQTAYTYDGGTVTSSGAPQHITVSGSRGNPTTIAYSTSGSVTLSVINTYYDTGMVLVAKDVAGHATTYSYSSSTDQCADAFPATITPAISTLATSASWNCNGGVMSSSTDANGQTTTFKYTDPNFWRLTEIDYPGKGKTTFAYSDTVNDFSIATSRLVSTALGNHTVTQYFDGVGRLIKSADTQACSTVDTTYDSLSRVYSVSNPYCSTNDSTYGLTYYSYDALGRSADEGTSHAIKYPDSSFTSITYSANCTTSTDPASKKRTLCSDALGRLNAVTEDPSGLNYQTSYGYNALNDLTSVSQGSQTRSYYYDQLGRLTSDVTPEAGTVTYTYPVKGSICSGDPTTPCTQKDNRGITTTYTYDAVNRLTSKSYSDGTTPQANFSYDQGSVSIGSWSSGTLPYPLGRLTEATTTSGSTLQTAVAFNYDQMGRVWDYWQCTPANCGNATIPHLNYTYDAAGDVLTWLHPGGFTITNTIPTPSQRVTEISSSISDSTHPPVLAQNITYTPWGAVAGLTNGCAGNSCTATVESYTYNNRLQLSQIQLGTSGNSSAYYSLTYNYSLPGSTPTGCPVTPSGSGNNGDVIGYTYTDGTGSYGHSASYVYDTLNRLVCAAASGSSSAAYNQEFSYDRYGNMTCVTNGYTFGPPCPAWTYNGSNQITLGFNYDAAGDVASDGVNFYSWDAEQHMTSINNGTLNMNFNALGWRVYEGASGTTLSYFTDPAGQFLGANWGPSWNAAVPFGGRTLAEYSGETSNPAYFDHPNVLGSEEQWTNAAGASAGEVDFSPWGYKMVDTTNGSMYQLFASLLWYDPQADGYQTPNRYYIPRHGAWLSPDPLRGDLTNPQSLNRYAYVLNNPTTSTDPLGLSPGEWWANSDCGMSPCYGGHGSGQCFIDRMEGPCGLAVALLTNGAAAACPLGACEFVNGLGQVVQYNAFAGAAGTADNYYAVWGVGSLS
jgi:RHS repeat-associated protein